MAEDDQKNVVGAQSFVCPQKNHLMIMNTILCHCGT